MEQIEALSYCPQPAFAPRAFKVLCSGLGSLGDVSRISRLPEAEKICYSDGGYEIGIHKQASVQLLCALALEIDA